MARMLEEMSREKAARGDTGSPKKVVVVPGRLVNVVV